MKSKYSAHPRYFDHCPGCFANGDGFYCTLHAAAPVLLKAAKFAVERGGLSEAGATLLKFAIAKAEGGKHGDTGEGKA